MCVASSLQQQKCSKVRDSTPHTAFRTSWTRYREKVGVRSCSAADSTVAGVCGGTYGSHRGAMAAVLVEQRHSVALEVHPRRRVDGRAWHAHLPSLRELRVRLRVLVVTSSESLSTAGLSRCPRTVLKAQLLLFATCKGEANALRKSRLRDELLLVKAQLRFFGRSPARRPR